MDDDDNEDDFKKTKKELNHKIIGGFSKEALQTIFLLKWCFEFFEHQQQQQKSKFHINK